MFLCVFTFSGVDASAEEGNACHFCSFVEWDGEGRDGCAGGLRWLMVRCILRACREFLGERKPKVGIPQRGFAASAPGWWVYGAFLSWQLAKQ